MDKATYLAIVSHYVRLTGCHSLAFKPEKSEIERYLPFLRKLVFSPRILRNKDQTSTGFHLYSLVHVEVGTAYISSCDSDEDISRALEFSIRNIFDADIARSIVHKCLH